MQCFSVIHMRKHQLLLFGGLVFGAGVVLAQTFPRTLPADLPSVKGTGIHGVARPQWEAERRYFYLSGGEYLSAIYPERNALGPEWESSAPLPIGLAKAEETARRELRKLVDKESSWVVTDFQISRFGLRSNWYYVITFKPEMGAVSVRPESFTVLVDFSGKPGLIGRIAGGKTH